MCEWRASAARRLRPANRVDIEEKAWGPAPRLISDGETRPASWPPPSSVPHSSAKMAQRQRLRSRWGSDTGAQRHTKQHIVTTLPQKGRRALARSGQERLTRGSHADAEVYLLIVDLIRDRRRKCRGAE